jgi:hypothetical protein
VEWVELIDAVEHRLGMFTGLPTYERAVSLVLGFDLGAGTDINKRLQTRAREKRDAGPIAWSTALLWEITNNPRPDERALTAAQNKAAIRLLCDELRAVVDAT